MWLLLWQLAQGGGLPRGMSHHPLSLLHMYDLKLSTLSSLEAKKLLNHLYKT